MPTWKGSRAKPCKAPPTQPPSCQHPLCSPATLPTCGGSEMGRHALYHSDLAPPLYHPYHRDSENEEAQVTWAPCKAGSPSDDARHTLGLQQRVPVPVVYIGEYTSPAKAAPEPIESRPKQCPRVGEPRHRGGTKRVH